MKKPTLKDHYQIEHTRGWSDLKPHEVDLYKNSNANVRIKPEQVDELDFTTCITFNKKAQDLLPEHIKIKMEADREKAQAGRTSVKHNIGIVFSKKPIRCTYCVTDVDKTVVETGDIKPTLRDSHYFNGFRRDIIGLLKEKFPDSRLIEEWD